MTVFAVPVQPSLGSRGLRRSWGQQEPVKPGNERGEHGSAFILAQAATLGTSRLIVRCDVNFTCHSSVDLCRKTQLGRDQVRFQNSLVLQPAGQVLHLQSGRRD